MPIIKNKDLYEIAKEIADKTYKKSSAYKSGFIIKTYKKLGGEYIDDNKPKKLKQWFKEEWGDIGEKNYPVFRPFKKINSSTPLTIQEIDPEQAKEQIKLKQIFKGDYNLPPFKKKIGKGINENLQKIPNIKKDNKIWTVSNPILVRKNADKYLGKNIDIYLSTNKNKKYMVQNEEGKFIHFGSLLYQDYTYHRNLQRRNNYLNRSAGISKSASKYNANNLSRNLLW